MKKVQAPTLEEAYEAASKALGCPVTKLQCEVIQYPSGGILGFFKKDAIIVASCKQVEFKEAAKQTEITRSEKTVADEYLKKETKLPVSPPKELMKEKPLKKEPINEDLIVENFFKVKETPASKPVVKEHTEKHDELAREIEAQLKALIALLCFDIDVVEVDIRDNTALIFIDGEDAALLIGKEGYRYNAFSYMLFNWLHTKYELYIKLEIAEFFTSQQEMIRNYIKPVIENVEKNGKGKTRYLDGILVQIALEQLRETFPNKYVAVKTSREGKKFVVINEFNKPTP